MELHPIARIHSDFPAKFGIPRQSGLVPGLEALIVFEPPCRDPAALRGLEAFSHLWLIWGASALSPGDWSPTVRPPRLGGNARLGVFATRALRRPNPLGLSAVEIAGIEETRDNGTVIRVRGADLLDGTPIYDVKPYLPYADAIPGAKGGFANAPPNPRLTVEADETRLACLPPEKRESLKALLALDPRPAYQDDPARIHGLIFAGCEIKFRVTGNRLIIIEAYRIN
ncbi:MAG: tRNA (N6-threonylcarbamoyladenosine(37)-N6)-methyltransferase TrmO [Oscillospiraceae bacterium]|nr:tRNA (N6-threonylcarbamoyladenosine(37)-N6)-methyltransferase TrmO [Oscillospiraceae bacterium]